MKAPELDADALLERIANALGDCLAVGSLNGKNGALSAALPCTEPWTEQLLRAAAGSVPVFPNARLGAVAALLHKISEDKDSARHFDQASLLADDSRIVFQRCPWNEREVLFVVLRDNTVAEMTFALLRLVLESIRRDVAIVRAPRVEERCWN